MNSTKARAVESISWLPTERLGQSTMDSHLRPWLIGKGLLSERMRAACGERYSHRVVDQWTGLLDESHRGALRVADGAGLFRDVVMSCSDQAWVFAQTVVPDSTLCKHSWLAELGDGALGETLSDLSGVERSAYEYAWLPVTETLPAHALREAEVKPTGLWARRSRLSLRQAPMMVQELFLPAMGRGF